MFPPIWKSPGAIPKRDEAYRALERSQKLLAKDVAQAAAYVRSLLPAPLVHGPIHAGWTFVPSARLGGDSFGYHDLDDEHFAFYLLDVCGHGIGAALLSVSVLTTLRTHALPDTDFRDPAQVAGALNRAFPMDRHDGRFFTIWYGVFSRSTRVLTYCGAGHPPGLVVPPLPPPTTIALDSKGPMVGVDPDMAYPSGTVTIEPGSRVFLYSDGVYELERSDGTMCPFEQFAAAVARLSQDEGQAMDRIIAEARAVGASGEFIDDVSIVELRFD